MKTITIFEDWNERNGKVYYRWRLADPGVPAEDSHWHEVLTGYSQKPIMTYKLLTEAQLDEHLEKFAQSTREAQSDMWPEKRSQHDYPS